MNHPAPDFRATIDKHGALRLVDWGPWLGSVGPCRTLIHARGRAGVSIADLTVVRDEHEVARELVVDFLCGGWPAHRTRLKIWAARVGYTRLWFDGEVAELDPLPGGVAQTRCTGCGARLVDADPTFWEYVRARGAFPSACVLCGSDLPQWTPVRQKAPRAGDPVRTPNPRSTPCN